MMNNPVSQGFHAGKNRADFAAASVVFQVQRQCHVRQGQSASSEFVPELHYLNNDGLGGALPEVDRLGRCLCGNKKGHETHNLRLGAHPQVLANQPR